MTARLQFQALAILSVESDLVRFSVLSSEDGREVATSTKRLTLMTTRRIRPTEKDRCDYDEDAQIQNDETHNMPGCSTITPVRPTPTGPGYVEQDPDKIWEAVEQVINEGIDKMCRDGTPVTYIKSIALTNEMGTLISWDATTGVALHNAIHWTDSRMVESTQIGRGGTASAVEWLIQWSAAVSSSAENRRFGTLDTWILWKLTGGQTYVTDVTNASYTRLLDLGTLNWDQDACLAVGLSRRSWPTVQLCGYDTTVVVTVGRLLGLSVHVSMARPSAVLYGQGCKQRGQAVLTLSDRTAVAIGAYERIPPRLTKWNKTNGPLPVVGYCEPDYSGCTRTVKIVYGLMATSTANSIVCWLKNNVSLVSSAEECMNAYSTARAAGNQAYMVPALSGLPSAPHRKPEARMVVCGLTESMGRVHMITAAVDGMCYNAADMIECVTAGATARHVDIVYADGWYSEYGTVLQMVADISGSKVIKNRDDMAVHGVARMAASIINARYRDVYETLVYRPIISDQQRATWAKYWRKAVFRSYGWANVNGRKSADEFSRIQPPSTTIAVIHSFADNLIRGFYNTLIFWTPDVLMNTIMDRILSILFRLY